MSQWWVLFAKILSSFNPDSVQLQPVLTGFHLLPSTHTATRQFFSCNSNNGRGEGCHSTTDCAVMNIMVMLLCFIHRKSTYSRCEREGGRQQPLAELKRHHVYPVALQQHGAACEEEAQSKTRAGFEALMMQMWKPADLAAVKIFHIIFSACFERFWRDAPKPICQRSGQNDPPISQ